MSPTRDDADHCKGQDDENEGEAEVATGKGKAQMAIGKGAKAFISMSAEVGTDKGFAAIDGWFGRSVGVSEARRHIGSEMKTDPYAA